MNPLLWSNFRDSAMISCSLGQVNPENFSWGSVKTFMKHTINYCFKQQLLLCSIRSIKLVYAGLLVREWTVSKRESSSEPITVE